MSRVTVTLDLSDAERQAICCAEGGPGFSREVHDLKWGVVAKLRKALEATKDQPKQCGGSGEDCEPLKNGDHVRLSPSFGGGVGKIVGDFHHSSWPVRRLDTGEEVRVASTCMERIDPDPTFQDLAALQGEAGGGEPTLTTLIKEYEGRAQEDNLTDAQRGVWEHAARRLTEVAARDPEEGREPEGDVWAQYRTVVKQCGDVLPLTIQSLAECTGRVRDIRAEMAGTEVEDAWVEKRQVTYGRWWRLGPDSNQNRGGTDG